MGRVEEEMHKWVERQKQWPTDQKEFSSFFCSPSSSSLLSPPLLLVRLFIEVFNMQISTPFPHSFFFVPFSHFTKAKGYFWPFGCLFSLYGVIYNLLPVHNTHADNTNKLSTLTGQKSVLQVTMQCYAICIHHAGCLKECGEKAKEKKGEKRGRKSIWMASHSDGIFAKYDNCKCSSSLHGWLFILRFCWTLALLNCFVHLLFCVFVQFYWQFQLTLTLKLYKPHKNWQGFCSGVQITILLNSILLCFCTRTHTDTCEYNAPVEQKGWKMLVWTMDQPEP